jgi:hypothetical protein
MEPLNNLTAVQNPTAVHQKRETFITQQSAWDRQAVAFEKARYFWMAIMITLQSCLGAIACLYILQNNASTFTLSACAALSMGSNALFIGLAPAKWCLIGFYLSILFNTIFILMNLV